jgi:hypothetical protein
LKAQDSIVSRAEVLCAAPYRCMQRLHSLYKRLLPT